MCQWLQILVKDFVNKKINIREREREGGGADDFAVCTSLQLYTPIRSAGSVRSCLTPTQNSAFNNFDSFTQYNIHYFCVCGLLMINARWNNLSIRWIFESYTSCAKLAEKFSYGYILKQAILCRSSVVSVTSYDEYIELCGKNGHQ